MTRNEFASKFGFENFEELKQHSDVLFEDSEKSWLISQAKDGRWGAWLEWLEDQLPEELDEDLIVEHDDKSNEDLIVELNEGPDGQSIELLDDKLAKYRVRWFDSYDQAEQYFNIIWVRNHRREKYNMYQ